MNNPSQEYIEYICSLYGSSYDDRIENSRPPTAGTTPRIPGDDWMPGTSASHKSLGAFQKELAEHGIKLSTSKIKKILVTGGLWTTESTRMIQELFSTYTAQTSDGGQGMDAATAIKAIATELGISAVSVSVSLPYSTVVYKLDERSSNAKRCARYQKRVTAKLVTVKDLQECGDKDWRLRLWRCVVSHEGVTFTTSGRGSRLGVKFLYEVSRSGSSGGRHYDGEDVPGYGNELWITTSEGKKKKSISRSSVELAYKRAEEMGGIVPGPKALGVPGAGSYLYPILKEFGIIKQGET